MALDSSPHAESELEAPRPGEGQSEQEGRDGAEPTLDGVFAPDGVDLTVIRWMLQRTPEERLQAAQQVIDAAWALRGDEA